MIKVKKDKIVLRPSSVDSYYGCSYQWGKTHLEGVQTIPNDRALIGTAIHTAAEVMWTEAKSTQTKEYNLTAMKDAAVDSWAEGAHDGVVFTNGSANHTTAIDEIMKGAETFISDIVPFVDIPTFIEQRFTMDLNNPLIKSLSGSVDHGTEDTISDLKTSKRASGPQGHVTQQTIYTMLAKHNGVPITKNRIQSIILTKTPKGLVQDLQPNEPKARYMINQILADMEVIASDVVPIETVLKGNPKYIYCSSKFCALYNTCPYINGKIEAL